MTALLDQLAIFIAKNDCTHTLLAEHCCDEHGRCGVCRSGPQGPGVVWPCKLHRAAEVALGLLPAVRR